MPQLSTLQCPISVRDNVLSLYATMSYLSTSSRVHSSSPGPPYPSSVRHTILSQYATNVLHQYTTTRTLHRLSPNTPVHVIIACPHPTLRCNILSQYTAGPYLRIATIPFLSTPPVSVHSQQRTPHSERVARGCSSIPYCSTALLITSTGHRIASA
eukprot:352079-Rhodomonas_salina.1